MISFFNTISNLVAIPYKSAVGDVLYLLLS